MRRSPAGSCGAERGAAWSAEDVTGAAWRERSRVVAVLSKSGGEAPTAFVRRPRAGSCGSERGSAWSVEDVTGIAWRDRSRVVAVLPGSARTYVQYV